MSSWLTDIARPEIRALQAYEHAVWEPGLVRLHANELPWRVETDASAAGLNRYPEPHPMELAAALARLYGVPIERLLVGRGIDEAIDLLIRSYCRAGHDAVMVCPPTFGMYAVAARIQGAELIEVPLQREAGYTLDLSGMLRRLSEAVRLVFVCSPNNPTGNRLARERLLQLAQALQGRALLVIDEAYVEFADGPSLLELLGEYPGIALLRTLSKAYGLAGARCGALIAHADVVALLRKVIQPYAITQLTIEAALKTLAPDALAAARARVAILRSERSRLAEALSRHSAVRKVWPSEANFLLVEFRDPDAALRRTHEAGLLVRDLRTASGLGAALRISVGTPQQNQRLLTSLRA